MDVITSLETDVLFSLRFVRLRLVCRLPALPAISKGVLRLHNDEDERYYHSNANSTGMPVSTSFLIVIVVAAATAVVVVVNVVQSARTA